jgi:hypothetical protein
MQFVHVDPARIEREWPAFAEILAPAVRVHAGAKMQTVYERLMSGYFHMLEHDAPDASGLLVFRVFDDEGKVSCFASYVAGKVPGGPKQMIRTMRTLMAAFEQLCREAGVYQIYIGGRDWSRVFPDYLPADDEPNRLRKVIV